MTDIIIFFVFAIVAILYSAAGQAGGTGYIAILALLGIAPEAIKSTALTLNILVAAIGCVQFARAGLLTWRSCYPFAILGAPFSLAGGALNLPAWIYQPVVGALLLLAAVQITRTARSAAHSDKVAPSAPPFLPSLLVGGAIGFVSGITGVGGGIFLAPLVLMLGWTATLQAGAISAVFNLLNSSAALAGFWSTSPNFLPELPFWLAAVAIGGIAGSWLGMRFLNPRTLRTLLALLLLAAGLRMLAANYF